MTQSFSALIVDGSPGDAGFLHQLLNQLFALACICHLARTLEEAETLYLTHRPDVVLVEMEGLAGEGHRVIQHLRGVGEGRQQSRFILLTEEPGEGSRHAVIRAGASDYLVKGAIDGEIVARVLLHAREMKRNNEALRAALAALAYSHQALERRMDERIGELHSSQERLLRETHRRKRVAKALKNQRQRSAAIGQAVRDAILMLDSQQRVIHWNPAAGEMFRHSVEEAQGLPVEAIFQRGAGERWPWEGRDETAAKGRGVPEGLNHPWEMTGVRRDGGTFPCEVVWSPLTVGKKRYLVGVVRDCTRRHATDRDLRMAKERAEEATRLKDKFVSLVAHDLRAPFTTLLGFSELLEGDGEHALDPFQEEIVSRIRESSQHALTIIHDLLDITRLQSGKIVPRPRFLDAACTIGQLIARLGHLAERKGVVVVNEVPPGTRLRVDPNLFWEVLNNLFTNAVKFCRQGDLVRFLVPPLDSGALLAVQDTGVGVDPELLGRLFHHEERTTTPGTAGEVGTGLGLPLCQDILQAHGGSLEVNSRPGGGTTVLFRLPPATPTVLLIDDDPELRRLMTRFLSQLETQVVEAPTAGRGLEVLRRQTVDLVILDLHLPDGDGFQLLQRLRADPLTRELPIILITADEESGVREQAFHYGADDFLSKPEVMNETLPRVRHFIG